MNAALQLLFTLSLLLFCSKEVHGHHTHPLSFPHTSSSHGDLDCRKAFAGKGKASYGGSAHAGLVHPHGPCSPIKELSHLSNDMPKLALELLKKDQERLEKHLFKKRLPRDHFIERSLAASTSTRAREETTSALRFGAGNYIMKVGVGSPRSDFLLMMDTGSDLSWTQCFPCDSQTTCYPQASPIFDPNTSSSYTPISCTTLLCTMCSSTGNCQYSLFYGDGSSTFGELAKDTFTIGNATIQQYIFGCGHLSQGTFLGVDGLLGLAWGSLGMPAQTVSFFGGVFAYCLPSILSSTNTIGFIEFGAEAISEDNNARYSFTPMIHNVYMPSFYFVWLKAISVRGVPLSLDSTPVFPPSSFDFFGTFVDSGTVITRLPYTDYVTFRNAFIAESVNITILPTDRDFFFDTCFRFNDDSLIPTVEFHFDGFDLPLDVENIVYPWDLSTNTVCLAFAPTPSTGGPRLLVIGNYQTPSRLMSFDTLGSRMGIVTSSKMC
ncbi:hypothetical protein GOP47_0015077 [Adiantum capillus-veneris]|uniref:Peptidase A1 domain-containing protein n=1 Tax=Adiantum capillus-veneris TaxID=13818 RepID=A0A9D4ZD15_ADICA|nr:hypothetical protein GOP47_0015077 [Adiantum capillus-veneris]